MVQMTAKNLSPEYKGQTAKAGCGKYLQRKSNDATKSLKFASVLGGDTGPKPRKPGVATNVGDSDQESL